MKIKSGPIMLDLKGPELSKEESEILQHPQVGGLILFSRNYKSPSQIEELVHKIRRLTKERLLIAVDQEGGRVQRFREGFTPLPPLGTLGKIYDRHPKQALHLAEQHAWLMATEILAVDIDFSFTPVLDLGKGISQVIGDRAFHSKPDIVTKLAKAYIHGMREAGMAAVGKHFPGHGSIAPDSHVDIPVDPRSYDSIAREDLIPFAKCSKDLRGIMPAHVIYSAIDPLPAGFSSFWLLTVLRQQLAYDGAIFSDDLSMKGATQIGDMQKRVRAALGAGCDMALVCNDPNAAIKVLEDLERSPMPRNEETLLRLQRMVGQRRITRAELHESPRWREIVSAINTLYNSNK